MSYKPHIVHAKTKERQVNPGEDGKKNYIVPCCRVLKDNEKPSYGLQKDLAYSINGQQFNKTKNTATIRREITNKHFNYLYIYSNFHPGAPGGGGGGASHGY